MGLTHKAILTTYVFLLICTGGMMLFFGGVSTLPLPTDEDLIQKLQRTLTEPALKLAYDVELAEKRERLRRLTELAISGFTTVLGALIGFLSSSWTTQSPLTSDRPVAPNQPDGI
jgi:hypothetical protein